MIIRQRKILIFALFVAWVLQSLLVYFDQTGLIYSTLTTKAKHGREFWLKKNCQSCHQIYGFGGFLGPDLTNITKHLTDERIEHVLTFGSKQMPAFNFNKYEQDSIIAYLSYLNKTGSSIPKVKIKKNFFDCLIKSTKKISSYREFKLGFNIMIEKRCFFCHLPNKQSSLMATDLMEVAKKLTKNKIFNILKYGKIDKGMPSFMLSKKQANNVYNYLLWINKNKVKFNFNDSFNMMLFWDIPWFEYE